MKSISIDFAKIIGLVLAWMLLDWKTAIVLTVLSCRLEFKKYL